VLGEAGLSRLSEWVRPPVLGGGEPVGEVASAFDLLWS
jgi:hypothetical protein